MLPTSETTLLIQRRIEAGESTASIAEDVGVTDNALRQRLRRAGFAMGRARAAITHQSYEAVVADMRPADAVDYLLGVVDLLRGFDEGLRWRVVQEGFTRQEAALLLKLIAHEGAPIAPDRMFLAMCEVYPDRDQPDPKMVDVVICKVRRKVRDRWGAAARIITVNGEGKYFERDPGFRFPWEADMTAPTTAAVM